MMIHATVALRCMNLAETIEGDRLLQALGACDPPLEDSPHHVMITESIAAATAVVIVVTTIKVLRTVVLNIILARWNSRSGMMLHSRSQLTLVPIVMLLEVTIFHIRGAIIDQEGDFEDVVAEQDWLQIEPF